MHMFHFGLKKCLRKKMLHNVQNVISVCIQLQSIFPLPWGAGEHLHKFSYLFVSTSVFQLLCFVYLTNDVNVVTCLIIKGNTWPYLHHTLYWKRRYPHQARRNKFRRPTLFLMLRKERSVSAITDQVQQSEERRLAGLSFVTSCFFVQIFSEWKIIYALLEFMSVRRYFKETATSAWLRLR